MKYFDKKENRLVFIEKKASNDFWDQHWLKNDIKRTIESGKNERFVSSTTKKFIKPGKDKTILEGGCGIGDRVYSLEHCGYKAIGVDYAKKTIDSVKEIVPDLDIRLGDVRRLAFDDEYFDSYWSLGVVEHFYNGYEQIMQEMQRVIKKEGFLFLTFPTMSYLRKIKAELGFYPLYQEDKEKLEHFYQFALDPRKVASDFENHEFILIEKRNLDGIKGLKDEIKTLKPLLQKLYDS